ncbi:hypothetical protein RF11_02260 [Thelohanellus kitauei]|uniref:Uncharacterized protein n=1 Tax=Thelohanellus kitauei TaxID=669202 RepID=A0A0C2MP65_THEKT|nr:hypothetical protein RF11_02260 [Thelohanellus kitauei]
MLESLKFDFDDSHIAENKSKLSADGIYLLVQSCPQKLHFFLNLTQSQNDTMLTFSTATFEDAHYGVFNDGSTYCLSGKTATFASVDWKDCSYFVSHLNKLCVKYCSENQDMTAPDPFDSGIPIQS